MRGRNSRNGQYAHRPGHQSDRERGRKRSDLYDGEGAATLDLDFPVVHMDPEFQALIPAQTDEEQAALEASLLAEGCRDALVVWQGHNILVDGHHRYALCQQHGILFQVIERPFETRDDVIVWMINNQLARRNITAFVRSELALRMKDAIAAKAKANQGKRNDIPQIFAESFAPTDTRAELAKVASVSHETVRKVAAVTKSAPEAIKTAARSGELSVDRAYKLTKALDDAPASRPFRPLWRPRPYKNNGRPPP